MSILEIFCRTAIDPVPVLEAQREAFPVGPEPSILDREQMEIDAKRTSLAGDAENYDAAAEYHERQAAIFRRKKADTLRILDGLAMHEAHVNAPMIEALGAVGAEIDAAIDEITLHDRMADEIEKNLSDRRPKPVKAGKRAAKTDLVAAE